MQYGAWHLAGTLGGLAMFKIITENGLVAGVVSGLLVAGVLGLLHRLWKRLRRQHRVVTLVDPSGNPVVGCRLGYPKFGIFTEKRSDLDGHLGVPLNWPDKIVVDVWRNGQRLLNDVKLDFGRNCSVTLVVPTRGSDPHRRTQARAGP